MSVQIKFRRDTASNWSTVNPTLGAGEPGLETDTLKIKYGDGTTTWNNLAYPTVLATPTPSSALTGTTLPPNIVNSSLTSVGTLSNLTVTNAIYGSITGNAATATTATTATNAVNATTATTANTAITLSGGAANQLVYQTGTGTISFVTAPALSNTFLNWSGTAFVWSTIPPAAASTLTGTTLNSTVVTSSLTSVGTLTNLTVTNTINGSVSGSAGSVSALNLSGNSLPNTITASYLTSVGTLTNLAVTNPIAGSITGAAPAGSLSGTALNNTVVTSSLTSVGTIGTGIWQGTVIGATYGGTGVNNGSATLTMAGSVVHSGAYTKTFTATGTTNLTLPTSGTLATLSGSETLSNKAIAAASSVLVGPATSANITRFPNAQTVISNTVSGIQQNEVSNIGLMAEGVGNSSSNIYIGVGLLGAGYTAGGTAGYGVRGTAHVSVTGDTASAMGVRGNSNDTHAGGMNVALYGDATNGATNYALYMNNGNIYSAAAQSWTLNGNLSFSGAYNIAIPTLTLTNPLAPTYGGTGVSNGANNTITFTGNYTLGVTLSANTAVTLPVSGTLATLGGSETLANKTLTTPSVTTSLDSTSGSFTFLASPTTLIFGGNATTVTKFANATSVNIGSAATSAQTVNMFTSSTGASTYNLFTGPVAASTTKSINIGTGGVSSSVTNIILGSSAGTGTITLNQPLTAGVNTLAPLKFTTGTNLTTAQAGAIEYDGAVFYASPAASTRSVIAAEQYTVLTSTYTLTSQTGAQKLFNTSTNGAVTLPIGNYQFECFFSLSSMNAGSGQFGFALGGTATFTQSWYAEAQKSTSNNSPAAPFVTWNTSANTGLTTANVNTLGFAFIRGYINITVGGTVIPQVSLTLANAAVVGVGSYFKISPLSTGNLVGNWS
jgi:hypothetical protein